MAKHEHTKTLKRVIPTIRTSDNVVKEWDIEVIYTSTDNNWKVTYSHKEDVEYLGKTASQFTKSQLLDMMPSQYSNHIFDAHWEAHNLAPTTEKNADFDLTQLPD